MSSCLLAMQRRQNFRVIAFWVLGFSVAYFIYWLWSLSSITCIVCTDMYFLIQGNVTSLFWDFARSCFHMSVCQKFQPSTNIIKAQIVQNSFVIGLNIWRWSKFLLQWSPILVEQSCDYLHNLLSRRGFQLLNRACRV